jgi:hypothetical protein
MQPIRAVRGLLNEHGELRLDPGWRVIGNITRLDASIACSRCCWSVFGWHVGLIAAGTRALSRLFAKTSV